MNLNFSYRMLAVIETEKTTLLDSDEHIGVIRSAAEIHSAMIWKNEGEYALISHFQLAETCRIYDEVKKYAEDIDDTAISPIIFWDDCIPIPNELAEELLWKREPENKSDKSNNGSASDHE